jgi:hypothetical protein
MLLDLNITVLASMKANSSQSGQPLSFLSAGFPPTC